MNTIHPALMAFLSLVVGNAKFRSIDRESLLQFDFQDFYSGWWMLTKETSDYRIVLHLNVRDQTIVFLFKDSSGRECKMYPYVSELGVFCPSVNGDQIALYYHGLEQLLAPKQSTARMSLKRFVSAHLPTLLFIVKKLLRPGRRSRISALP